MLLQRHRIGLLVVGLLAGCESMNHAEKGALGGGAIGAGTGALIGNAVGHTGAGAVIGAAVGALSGTLIGDSIDESERKTDAKIIAASHQTTAQGGLGVTDVVQMAQSHISDEVIISQIRATRSVFNLSANDTIWLKQNGVSDLVVKEMLATPNRYPKPVYTRPVYIIERPSPVYSTTYYGYGTGW